MIFFSDNFSRNNFVCMFVLEIGHFIWDKYTHLAACKLENKNQDGNVNTLWLKTKSNSKHAHFINIICMMFVF